MRLNKETTPERSPRTRPCGCIRLRAGRTLHVSDRTEWRQSAPKQASMTDTHKILNPTAELSALRDYKTLESVELMPVLRFGLKRAYYGSCCIEQGA